MGPDGLVDGGERLLPEPAREDDRVGAGVAVDAVDDEVTVSGRWRLTRAADGSRAELSGPAGATYRPPSGFTYSDVLIDGQFAVVVAQHQQETKPNVAEVVDLSNGGVTRIDGRSDPATTTGGSWALGSGFLVHATVDGRDYCLATVDLVSGRGQQGPCVPPGNGNSLHDHKTVEVFIPLTSRWRIVWGERGESAVELEPYDVISIPPGVHRHYTNIGNVEGLLLTVLGGRDSGKVTWAKKVLDEAREHGVALDERGEIVAADPSGR